MAQRPRNQVHWHLVAWHFRDGDFELVTTGATGMRTIEVAPDLL